MTFLLLIQIVSLFIGGDQFQVLDLDRVQIRIVKLICRYTWCVPAFRCKIVCQIIRLEDSAMTGINFISRDTDLPLGESVQICIRQISGTAVRNHIIAASGICSRVTGCRFVLFLNHNLRGWFRCRLLVSVPPLLPPLPALAQLPVSVPVSL